MAVDAIIVGGGFYGCCLALYASRNLKQVMIVEREDKLLKRASYRNQARLHQGYHYPRSWQTAERSKHNFNIFIQHFPEAVVDNFRHLYCIAGQNSHISCFHFERFCRLIGAPLQQAPDDIHELFNPHLIRGVYEVQEYAFDASKLRAGLEASLVDRNVDIHLNTTVNAIETNTDKEYLVELDNGETLATRWLFNCTYSGLNFIEGVRHSKRGDLKHEITEMPLIEPPPELDGIGITVMDGPFFSMMPFPARGLYSFSHVRYTPHFSWVDKGRPDQNPYAIMDAYHKESNYPFMIRDAARYIPKIKDARYVDSIFEVKTLLLKTEIDDSRPILFDRNPTYPQMISILGGKIDNIFDILEFLRCQIKLQ